MTMASPRNPSKTVSRKAGPPRYRRHVTLLLGCVIAALAVVFAFAYLFPPDPPSETGGAPRTITFSPDPAPATAEQLRQESQDVVHDLLAQYPTSVEAMHVSAMMHAQIRESAEAERLWLKCIELSPKSTHYYVNLAGVAIDRGNSKLAADTLQNAIDRGISSPDMLRCLGMALMNLGRSNEAVEVISKGLAESPESAAIWQVLGQAQLTLRQAEEAESSLRKAIALGSRTRDVVTALANACAQQGKHDEATEYRDALRQLVAEKPIDPQARFQVLSTAGARHATAAILTEAAAVHALYGDALPAERLLHRAVAIEPMNVPHFRTLAALYRETGKTAEERAVWQRLVEIEPQKLDNYLSLAKACARLGDAASAEAALKLAITVRPEAAEGYASLAGFYIQTGNAGQARRYAQEAIHREPTAESYALLASACELLGNDSEAERAWDEARKRGYAR